MTEPYPQFDDLFGEVALDADGWWYYSEKPYVPADAEPHDYVEPALRDARETIEKAGCLIDNEHTGCDHDSLWIRFRPSDSEAATPLTWER